MLGLIAVSFYYCARRLFHQKRWLLWLLVFNLPVPWIAAELGWFVAEYGRQPWTIGEVLPTFLSTSSLSMADVIGSLIGLVVFYTVLLGVELFLMVKFIRLGPSCLHTGQYPADLASIDIPHQAALRGALDEYLLQHAILDQRHSGFPRRHIDQYFLAHDFPAARAGPGDPLFPVTVRIVKC